MMIRRRARGLEVVRTAARILMRDSGSTRSGWPKRLVAFVAMSAGLSGLWGASAMPALAEAEAPNGPPPAGAVEVDLGRRVFEATGGCTCHTNYPGEGADAPTLAGGRAMETPFGVFYSTNITPDPATGIGGWTAQDFTRAMRQGLSPEGDHYFPVFPYTSFTGLTDHDLRNLKAYLDSREPIARENKAPDAPFPFSWRASLIGWKVLNFTPERVVADPAQSPEWNRGRYLVTAAAHCGECHSPRTLTGGLDREAWLAGSSDGPEGELAPNITPHAKTGIGSWTENDLVWYLETGFKPDGDDTQGLMSEVIEHGYSKLSESDLRAIAIYLKSVPAIDNRVVADGD